MSVLIKGGKMPEYCGECDGCRFDNLNVEYRCFATGEFLGELDINKEKGKRCPLVEIPPHGRLIDKDKLEDVFWDILNEPKKYDKPLHCMMLELQTAPTVIESEEQEHENIKER